jgi:anaerobic magnesium-protoporphyrin IX monomethyl ester cyclase
MAESGTDILFVNPPLSLRERYGDLAVGGSTLPPLGLTNLAASVRAAGLKPAILDAAILELSVEETVEQARIIAPRVVGLTGATIAIGKIVAVARLIKKELPGVAVVVGGAHFSAAPEATLLRYNDCIDAGVVGEGDATVVELLNALLNGKPPDDVAGLALWRDGRTHFTAPRPLLIDLDSLPMEARDLLPFIPRHYHPAANCYLRAPSTSVITSRGCTGRCTFCDRTVSTSRLRGYSAARVLETIDLLVKDFGIKDVIFYDDNYVTMRKRLIAISEGLISRGLPVSWSCIARADMLDFATLKLMRRAGCWQIAYGVESGSQRILDSLEKGITLERIADTMAITKRAGIATRGFFMIGVPGESVETIKQTVSFMKQLPLDDFHMSFFTPWPASQLYHRIKESKYFDDIDEHWGEMNGWRPVYVPDGMTAAELELWQRRVFLSFYLRPKIILYYIFQSLSHPGLFARMIKGGFGMIKAFFVSRRRALE